METSAWKHFNVRTIITRLLRAAAVPVTAGSRRESKEFSSMLFYNASRFRGEKFPLETHCHRRVASIAAQLRENARPCGRIYAGSRYDVAQTRAVLVIVRLAAKMERRKFRRGKIPSRQRRAEIFATLIYFRYRANC